MTTTFGHKFSDQKTKNYKVNISEIFSLIVEIDKPGNTIINEHLVWNVWDSADNRLPFDNKILLNRGYLTTMSDVYKNYELPWDK